MSASRLAVRWGLVALLATGCRTTGGGNQELVERELRFQETELYRLRDEVDALQCQVDATQRENQALKKELTTGDTGAAPPRTAPQTPTRKAAEPIAPPKIDLPFVPNRGGSPPNRAWRSKPEAPPSELPSVEVEIPGVETSPPSGASSMPDPSGASLPRPDGTDLDEAPAAIAPERPTRDRLRAPVQPVAHQEPVAADQQIASVVLNPQLTGGRDRDGQAGDEALTVAFEPRNASGQLIRPTGEVSIVVLDPAAEGAAARVARWDFDAGEAARHFGVGALARGYYFELPWSGAPPAHADLHLFVRIKAADGSKQIADQPIHIRPPVARGTQLAGGLWPLRSAQANAAPPPDAPATNRASATPRFFSRTKASSAKQTPADATVDADGSMNVTIPNTTVPGAEGQMVVDGELFDGGGAKPAKTPRLIDRSRLRGGPGIFDGSRIRSLTGRDPAPAGRRNAPTPAAGGEVIVERGAAPMDVVSDRPADPRLASRVKPPPTSQSESVLAPPTSVDEPVGMQPAEDETPAEPPPPRYARPVWKPYR